MSLRQKILLLEDVEHLGRSGDVVVAKTGYVRNFLVPKKMAVVADKHTLKIQEKLKDERFKKAAVDKKESEELAKRIKEITLIFEVKVDHDGHLYGSVSQQDIVKILEKEGFAVDKKSIELKQHIKEAGTHQIRLKLKEGISTSFFLKVVAEGTPLEVVTAPVAVEAETEAKKEETEE